MTLPQKHNRDQVLVLALKSVEPLQGGNVFRSRGILVKKEESALVIPTSL